MSHVKAKMHQILFPASVRSFVRPSPPRTRADGWTSLRWSLTLNDGLKSKNPCTVNVRRSPSQICYETRARWKNGCARNWVVNTLCLHAKFGDRWTPDNV